MWSALDTLFKNQIWKYTEVNYTMGNQEEQLYLTFKYKCNKVPANLKQIFTPGVQT